jgi:hypothetical protein
LALLTGLTLVLAASIAQRGRASFTGQDTNTANDFTSAACFSGDTGLLDAGSDAADSGGDGDGFETSSTNAYADGGGNATNTDGAADRHRYYDYTISYSGSCSFAGLEVQLDWLLDSTAGVSSMDVELSWDAGTSWTSAKNDATESTTEHTTTLGSSSDNWGHAWTAGELGNTNFRVRVTSNSDDSTRDFFLDWVAVRVYYAP